MPRKMKMWIYPKPTSLSPYSKPYCIEAEPFLRELETVDSQEEYETVRDLNYGSVEATVREKVYDSGWHDCYVIADYFFPYILAPIIYHCRRDHGVVNCEVVAS